MEMVMTMVMAMTFCVGSRDEPVGKTCAKLETVNRLKFNGIVDENQIFDGRSKLKS